MSNNHNRMAVCFSSALVIAAFVFQTAASAKPFELGIQQKTVLPGDPGYQGEAAYPMPQAIPTPGFQGGVNQNPPLSGNVRSRPKKPKSKPMRANIQASVPLPQGFMGSWMVSGQRQGFEAQPQYQAAIPNIFSASTRNVWNISGNPQSGYGFTNDVGAKSSLYVNKVEGSTAFIRYGHPIKNTTAQEAVVMELAPDGMSFKGLERITIVKKGESTPRAKVTYQIYGVRQR